MSDEIKTAGAEYTLRRLKSVLGKAGALFGDVREHFRPVYVTLLGQVENELIPEAAQSLESEIAAIEQHAHETVEALKAKLIAAINSHIQQVSPAALAALYPPVSANLNQVSPIALPPVASPSPAGTPPGNPLPDQDAGEIPPAATPTSGDGGKN